MICKTCKKSIETKFQKCRSIGFGSYSSVNLVCNQENPKYIIKKFFDKNDSELTKCSLINQLNILSSKFVKIIDNQIIYSYIDGYNFNNYIYECSNEKFIDIIKVLINQLCHLENNNYYHLDINLNNIIIKNDTPYLIDFGTLTKKDSKLEREYYGSYGYVPPEYFNEKKLIFDKFDVFSIGIILFYKFCGFLPLSLSKYYKTNCWSWCKNSSCKDRGNCLFEFIEKNSKYKKINNIILKCLHFDHHDRINLKELALMCDIKN